MLATRPDAHRIDDVTESDIRFHLYSRDEQIAGEAGLESRALCGYVRPAGNQVAAQMRVPVDLCACPGCSELLDAAFEMLDDYDRATLVAFDPERFAPADLPAPKAKREPESIVEPEDETT